MALPLGARFGSYAITAKIGEGGMGEADAVAGKPQYAVTRGGRFLINQPAKEAIVTPITLLMNWNADAAR